jgi:hypothetical protein
MMKLGLTISALCLAIMATTPPCYAQAPGSDAPAAEASVLLTVFLHHDQSKNLAEINQELKKNGYYDQFPPPGVTVESWYVVMGIGQIVTLRVPASKLREVNTLRTPHGDHTARNFSLPTTTRRWPSSNAKPCATRSPNQEQPA